MNAPAASADTSFFGHPRGLSTLFFSEMWERFSYYGMRGFLILYMTAAVTAGGMGLDTATAAAIYGTYTSLVYLMSIPGGWLADRVLGQRKAVLYGGILIAAGHFTLAVPLAWSFYAGLVLIVLGTGLLKPNISAIVGQLYGRTISAATPASRSSTWGSTSAPSWDHCSPDSWRRMRASARSSRDGAWIRTPRGTGRSARQASA